MPPTGSLNLSLQVAGNATVNTTGGNDDERIWLVFFILGRNCGKTPEI